MNRQQEIVEAALRIYAAGGRPTFEAIAPVVSCSLRTVVATFSTTALIDAMRSEAVLYPAKCYRLAVEMEAERVGYEAAWGKLLCP